MDAIHENMPNQPRGNHLAHLSHISIPEGPWTDISYDLITGLPVSNGFDSLLTVSDWLKNMADFVTRSEKKPAKQLGYSIFQHTREQAISPVARSNFHLSEFIYIHIQTHITSLH